MIQWDDNTIDKLNEIKDELDGLLMDTPSALGNTWMDLFCRWKEENPYEFIVYLQDGLKEMPPKEILYFDPTDRVSVLFFDVMSMSVFISRSFVDYTRDIVRRVVGESHPDEKCAIIRKYFAFIDQSSRFETTFTLLYNGSHLSGVLQGEHPVDITTSANALHEILEKSSVESIFLLFSYWRITADSECLKDMVSAVVRYIREYYKEFGNDPEMHLDWPVEKESVIKQINILSRWIKLICYHVNGLLDEYKAKNWFISVDALVDEIAFPPFISYFEMLKYKSLYPNAENSVVQQKATYFHSYGVWIKTVDVMNILSQTASIIYGMPDEMFNQFGVSRRALLELSDNLKKCKEYFSGLLFTHKEYYDSMRAKFSFLVLETYEHSARQIGKSVDDLILFTNAVLSNDITELLRAKQEFRSHISGFITKDQEQTLDEYMTKVAEKIKEEIRKLDIYQILYGSITSDFQRYAQQLLAYPDIFCSLVSAEYLYQEYVEGQTANPKFDYSCISIMYYMALEDFANKLLYSQYAINVLDKSVQLIRYNYLPYISHAKNFWDSKNRRYKRSCEIGNLGHLFNAVVQETEYQKYLRSLYPAIDIQRLSQYGANLINVAPRRNEAAHGGKLITYHDVCIDKQNVYDSAVKQYRGLIMELFGIVFPNL